MNWKIQLNPFLRYSEKKLFIFGIICFVLGIFLETFSKITNGNSSINDPIFWNTLSDFLQMNILRLLVTFVILLVFGKIINIRTRPIDILNVILIAKIPGYFLLGTKGLLKNEQIKFIVNQSGFQTIVLILQLIIIGYLFFVFIKLLYKGFKVATNAKKWQHFALMYILVFTTAILFRILEHKGFQSVF